jgi:hypothetical protein
MLSALALRASAHAFPVPALSVSRGFSSKPIGGLAHAPSCACNSCNTGKIAGMPVSERSLSVASQARSNRGVVYMGPNEVKVKPIEFPKLELDSTKVPERDVLVPAFFSELPLTFRLFYARCLPYTTSVSCCLGAPEAQV